MKKTILITLTTLLVSIFLFPAFGFSSGSDRYGYDEYEDYEPYDRSDYSYSDYEFRFSDAVHDFDRCRGPVYYFRHPRGSVYFVLVGQNTYVVPVHIFRRYTNRAHFVWVPRARFISLSSIGLDYYDNYLRFNYYFDYYNRSRWNRKHIRGLRQNFKKYYRGRHHTKWYQKNRPRVMKQRHLKRRGYKNTYRTHERRKAKRYDRRNDRHNRNYDRKRSYKHSKLYRRKNRK